MRSASTSQAVQLGRSLPGDLHEHPLGPLAVVLRRQNLTYVEVCEALNRLGYRTRTGKLWRHLQEIIKLPRSFGEAAALKGTLTARLRDRFRHQQSRIPRCQR